MAAARSRSNSRSQDSLAVDTREFIHRQAVARVEWQVPMLALAASLSQATIACSNRKSVSKAYLCPPHLRAAEWARLQSRS